MTQEKKFYVYYLKNPLTQRIFYVGKGTGNRSRQHLTDKQSYAFNKRLNGYIRNLIESCNLPIIEKLQENLSEEEAYLLEEAEIKRLGRVGYEENGILLNILESGRPPCFKGEQHPWWGRKHSKESIEKMKRTKKRNKELGITKVRTGFTHTQETKEKISRKNSGKKRSPEAIEKTRQANLGRPQTDYQKKKAEDANSKKWLIIKPDGTEEIIVNLSRYCKENNLSMSSMKLVVNGRQKQHKGYKVFRLD